MAIMVAAPTCRFLLVTSLQLLFCRCAVCDQPSCEHVHLQLQTASAVNLQLRAANSMAIMVAAATCRLIAHNSSAAAVV
jgi:hypothetical protein